MSTLDENPHQLSRQTTPTWEVELLISGVAVFAMLQLPGWLDDRMFTLAPRLDSSWGQLLELLYFYTKSAAVILAATFVIHLLLRARWIALVGMHSVYPDGIRWDKLRMGPLQGELERRLEVSTETVIERADNLATTVFAVGVMLAMVLVVVSISVTVVLGASTIFASITGWEGGSLILFFLAFALVMLPYWIVVVLDRRYGARWSPGSRMHKNASALFGLFARFGMRAGGNRTRVLLASNGGDRRVGALIVVIMSVTIGTVMFSYWSMRKGIQFGSYASFPAGVSPAIKAAHYDDQRDPARGPLVPYVQSMVIANPYLELVIPYDPRQDGPALQRHCAQAGAGRDAALFHCLKALHAVALDGKPVAGLQYEVASDPRTSRPALLAMIDIRTLATGRHELRIGRAYPPKTSSDDTDNKADADAQDTIIPFWR